MFENFNAAIGEISFTGVSAHPMSANGGRRPCNQGRAAPCRSWLRCREKIKAIRLVMILPSSPKLFNRPFSCKLLPRDAACLCKFQQGSRHLIGEPHGIRLAAG